MRSGNYPIYKSIGAAQFSLMPPKPNDKGFLERNGAILLEVAPGDGNKNDPKWDWSKKIKFAIGLPDIAILLDQTKEQIRVVHDNKGVLKTLEILPGKDKFEGTFQLILTEGSQENRKKIMVPLSNGEYQVLMRLLVSAAPLLINWTPQIQAFDVQDPE
mgnify:CR=1 FL=1